MPLLTLPAADEHAPYYSRYIDLLDGPDVHAALVAQAASTARLLAATPESRAGHRYAPGKWSVREVVGHLADGERVFAYRALRFARNDATPLPGFDEELWMPESGFDRRTLADVADEFATVRAATLSLARGLDAAQLLRRGVANDTPCSVRALFAIIAGHERHHVGLLRERYGLAG